MLILTSRSKERRDRLPLGPYALNYAHPLAEGLQCGWFVANGHVVMLGATQVPLNADHANVAIEPVLDGLGLRKTATNSSAGTNSEDWVEGAGNWSAKSGHYHARYNTGDAIISLRWLSGWYDDTSGMRPLVAIQTTGTAGALIVYHKYSTYLQSHTTGTGVLRVDDASTVSINIAPNSQEYYGNGELDSTASSSNGLTTSTSDPSGRYWMRLGHAATQAANYYGDDKTWVLEQWASSALKTADQVAESHARPFWWLFPLGMRMVSLPAAGAAAQQITLDAAVTGTASVPSPTVTQEQSITLDAAVTGSASVPQPTVTQEQSITLGAAVTGSASIPSPTVTIAAAQQITLDAAVTGTASVPSPTVTQGQVIAPEIVLGSAQVNQPTITGGLEIAKGGGGGSRTGVRTSRRRRVMIGGRLYTVRSAAELERLLLEHQQHLEAQLERAEERSQPLAPIKRRLKLVARRIESVQSDADAWREKLRRDDEDLIIILSMLH